jgi:hypothetical protein
MDWEDQGRQYHMWFGHGTGLDNSKKSSPDPTVIAKTSEDRAVALVYGVIGALPAALRRQVESQYHNGTLTAVEGSNDGVAQRGGA